MHLCTPCAIFTDIRYAHIVSEDNPPFVRAASETRVEDSARTGPQVCFIPLPYLGVLVSLETIGFNVASHNPIKASWTSSSQSWFGTFLSASLFTLSLL